MKKFIFILLLIFCQIGFSASLTNAFNSGELDPLLRYRIDLDKKYLGVETMENFLVRPQGAAMRRPGTQYIETTKNSGEVELVSFEFATNDAYVIEMGDSYARFFRNGGQIQTSNGTETMVTGDQVAQWRCNETSGTTITDSVGVVPYTGTSSVDCDFMTQVGHVGSGCFNLDAQYTIEVADADGLSFTDNSADDPFSLVCWAYVTQQNEFQVLISKWRDSSAASKPEWRLSLDENRKVKLTLADSSANLESVRVAQWKLDESEGDTEVHDDTTAGAYPDPHDGVSTVITSTLAATGKLDGAFDFDGQYAVEVDDAADLSFGNGAADSAFSIAAWAYFTDELFIEQIVTKYDVALAGEWRLQRNSSSSISLLLFDDSTGASRNYQTANGSVSAGWHFIVATYDGTASGGSVYINGTLVSNTEQELGSYTAMEDTATKVAIGSLYSNGALTFNTAFRDRLDNVVIYNTELNQSDIDILWNNGVGTAVTSSVEVSCETDNALGFGWHFITSTYSAPADESTAADGIIIYIDSVAVDCTAVNSANYTAMQNDAEEVRIGSQRNAGDSANENFLVDRIDEVSIYSDVLTPAEIVTLYPLTTYEIETPYTVSQLSGIKYIQSNDVMYMVHPDLPVQKLIRIDHDEWTINDVDWEWGPFLDQNITTTTITPSGTTGTIELVASDNIFAADHVGSIWKIIEKSANSNTSGNLTPSTNSSNVAIEGDGLLTLEGTWTGLVEMEKSADSFATTGEPVYPRLNGTNANIEFSFNEPDAGYEYRVTMGAGTGSCNYTLTAYNSDVAGYVKVTAFTDRKTVTATVTSTLAGTAATTKWAEGAWSTRRGQPRAICIYQNRLCFAGTTFQPNGFWTSVSADLEIMRESTLDDGAIVYEVSSAKQNPILWLQDKNGIIAGTTGSVIRIFSQSSTSVLTPASIGSERQAEAGSADMQPALTVDSIVFVDRNRRKVRDMIYDLQSDGFVSPELTIMAEHITDPSLVDIAVQSRPDDVIWFIRSDGQLVSLTYNRNEGVVGWARHITDGEFESVAVIPGSDEDQIWVSVKRTLTSGDVRYIEQMQSQDWGTDPADSWFVDSGLAYSGVSTDTITGLEHLEGETVQAFYNSTVFESVTVSGGSVTLSESVTAATIGLPYTSTFLTFPIEVQTQSGFSIGYKKKIYEIDGCFYRTMNGQYGLKEQFTEPVMYDIKFSEWPDTTNGSEDPYTGLIRLEVDGGWSDEVQIKFVQSEPYPFNITAVQTKIEVSGD